MQDARTEAGQTERHGNAAETERADSAQGGCFSAPSFGALQGAQWCAAVPRTALVLFLGRVGHHVLQLLHCEDAIGHEPTVAHGPRKADTGAVSTVALVEHKRLGLLHAADKGARGSAC
jgi:hypothetical protein